MHTRRILRSAGFTLIEMAILVVVGFVIGGAFQILGPVITAQRGETTLHRLDTIQKALQVYVIAYGCLPCPANGATATDGAATFGRALDTGGVYVTATVHCTTNACANINPAVPWRDVGLSEQDVSDSWGSRIRYYVAGTPCTAGATGL